MNFDTLINRKGTYSTQWDYIEDRFGVGDLLPFTISDMDFAVCDAILDALQNRLTHPVFGYTRWNHSDYKKAIINWYQRRFDTLIDASWITYSPSVIYSIAKLIELHSNPGQGVVIQTPAYDGFYKSISASKRNIIENPLHYNDGIYMMDWLDLEEKLADPNNVILLLCSPHNPTGRVWSEEELLKLIHLCVKYHVFIISDEIHMDILRPQVVHTPIMKYVTHYSKMASCSSASKSFNVPGLGGSYLLTSNGDTQANFQKLLKNRDGLSSASVFGIEATMAAYSFDGEKWVDSLNRYLDHNLLIVKHMLDHFLPDCRYEIPQGTYLAWIDVSNYPFSMEELQRSLIDNGKVAIMSGQVYGGNGTHFLRFNVGCPESKVREGLSRLNYSIRCLLD